MGTATKIVTTSTQSLRDRVFAIIDGYEEANALLARARLARSASLPKTVTQVTDEVRERIAALLDAGEPVPWDIAKPIVAAEHDVEAVKIRHGLVGQIITRSQSHIEHLPGVNMAAALQLLRDELSIVVTTAKRHIENLDGARSPAQVLANGADTVRQAWSSLTDLTERYDEIRRVQAELLRATGRENVMEGFLTTGLFRNAIDVSPHWIQRRREAAGRSLGNPTGDNAHLTWLSGAGDYVPAVNSETSWWPDGDPTVALINIIEITEPWVPDVDVMMGAFRAASKATTEVRPQPSFSTVSPDGEQIHALENYKELTAGEPVTDPTASDLTTHTKLTKDLESQLKVERTAATIARARREEQQASTRARLD